jgi:hypothetical protein
MMIKKASPISTKTIILSVKAELRRWNKRLTIIICALTVEKI